MSIESDLVALLQAISPRTYPDVAPEGTATPYVTWQQIGGESLRYLDGTADSRYPLMQVNAWSRSRLESAGLIRQIEDAICASDAFQAAPQGEPISTHERETGLYGSIQRFDVFGPR